MTVSEFKIENHRHITEEVAERQPLYDGTYPEAGDKLIDCIVITDDNPDGYTAYFKPSQIGDFEIIDDPEYDVFLPLAEQKFKVKIK